MILKVNNKNFRQLEIKSINFSLTTNNRSKCLKIWTHKRTQLNFNLAVLKNWSMVFMMKVSVGPRLSKFLKSNLEILQATFYSQPVTFHMWELSHKTTEIDYLNLGWSIWQKMEFHFPMTFRLRDNLEIQFLSVNGVLRVFQQINCLFQTVLFVLLQRDGLWLLILRVRATSGLKTWKNQTILRSLN